MALLERTKLSWTTRSAKSTMDTCNFSCLVLQIMLMLIPATNASSFLYPAVFNFGDSNSDTGGLAASIGTAPAAPNGRTYFQKPSGRFCDGRLVVDFLMDAFGLPFLHAYLDSVGAPSFRRGCNFATAGSTILPPATATYISPFSFGIQVKQFFIFKAQVLDLMSGTGRKEKAKYLPEAEYFSKALYMFDIGQNDLVVAFYSKTPVEILSAIPAIIAEFGSGIQRLYDEGARNFWIHNKGPLGCNAQNIAELGTDGSEHDELGCVAKLNQAAISFNLHLHEFCEEFRGKYADANVTYVDIYTIRLQLLKNYARYGFQHHIMACCGYGGPPLNYDPRVHCGKIQVLNGTTATTTACNDSSKYVSWDGMHYTDAANQFVASEILTGAYSKQHFTNALLLNDF